eukprot:11168587-Lingulodinium_polyedra.AAC.1
MHREAAVAVDMKGAAKRHGRTGAEHVVALSALGVGPHPASGNRVPITVNGPQVEPIAIGEGLL